MSKETYHIWTKGDEKPETLPLDCEYLSTVDGAWHPSSSARSYWGQSAEQFIVARRWPTEPVKQRPTAYGLLSTGEREELKEAHATGCAIELLTHRGWGLIGVREWLGGNTYRIKEPKEQETLEFKVTMNGKPVDPNDFSAESWANFRK